MAPQTLTFLMTKNGTTSQAAAPVSLIPSSIAATLTNPVALILQKQIDAGASTSNNSGMAILTNTQGSSQLPVYVNGDQTLEGSWTTSPATFWDDPNCQHYLEITETGSFTKEVPTPPTSSAGFPLTGQIQFNLQVIHQFTGDCNPTFQALAKCYVDVNQCAGTSTGDNENRQQVIVALFQPYFSTHLITVDDIPNIMNYAYEITY
jgi:hypothetical protein